MRRNYRSNLQYHKQKYIKSDIDGKQMLRQRNYDGGELKSLQCSSVIQVQPTNESYENSWLQKLVSNIDESKPVNKSNDLFTRNMARKYVSDIKNIEPIQRRVDMENIKQKIAYSSNKSQNRSPITILQDRKHQFARQCSKFSIGTQQRTSQIYGNKKSQFTIERPIERIKQNNQNQDKYINEGSKSYGKIKRFNKSVQIAQTKKHGENLYNKHTIEIDSKYNVSPIKIERYQTHYGSGANNQKASLRNYTQYQVSDKNTTSEGKYATNESIYTSATGSYIQSKQSRGKSSIDSDYVNSEARSKKIPHYLKPHYEPYDKQYKKISASTFIEHSTKPNLNYEYVKTTTNNDKGKEKDEQLKMDEMAKRLNKVLQNISIKSNIIANRSDVSSQQSKKQNNTNLRVTQHRNINYHNSSQQKPQVNLYSKSNYTHYVKNILNEKSKQEQNSNIAAKQTNVLKIPEGNQARKKYESMKNSLGVSKHIPSQIILQQSSSEINSQISPRAQVLHLELKQLFDELDSNKIGELSKNNCASQHINSQIRCMLGGIFDKIKYKDERMTFKVFLQQCLVIAKPLGNQMSSILLKQKNNKNTFNLRLNEKDIQSQRWNTINESESKRSSGRSEVVKKYQFLQQKTTQQKQKLSNINQNSNYHKVHWITNDNKVYPKIFSSIDKNRNLTKTPYLNKQESVLDIKNQNNYYCVPTINLKDDKNILTSNDKKYVQMKQNEKQNYVKSFSMPKKEKVQQRKDFQRMCEKLNSKLDNYLTTIKTKEPSGPRITLQFSQLSKHWNGNRK